MWCLVWCTPSLLQSVITWISQHIGDQDLVLLKELCKAGYLVFSIFVTKSLISLFLVIVFTIFLQNLWPKCIHFHRKLKILKTSVTECFHLCPPLAHRSEWRSVLCGGLVWARYTTGYVYSLTLSFSFLFRTFLILHPDRGLVRNGRPNLRLFHQLYWVVVSSFLLVFQIILPGSSIYKGSFPGGTKGGRICLVHAVKQESDLGGEGHKITLMQLAFPTVGVIFIIYLTQKIRCFLHRLCPKRKFSCIGVYQRNIISFQLTWKWLLIWIFSSIFDVIFQGILAEQGGSISFWIWNIKGIIFNEGLHFILPLMLTIPNEEQVKPQNFYIRSSSVLEPRREFTFKTSYTAVGKNKKKRKDAILHEPITLSIPNIENNRVSKEQTHYCRKHNCVLRLDSKVLSKCLNGSI